MREENQTELPRRSNFGLWITLAVVGSLLLAWVFLVRPEISLKQATERPGVGQPLPLLELQPLTGTTEGVSLADLRGKVVLINYWGTWCPPCQVEFPHMVELWDKYRGKPDFLFLSVSSTFADREDVAAVREVTAKFLQAKGTTMPTFIDADGASRATLAGILGRASLGYPTTLLLDRTGAIRAIWEGYQSGYEGQMEKLVSQLLNEQPEVNKTANR